MLSMPCLCLDLHVYVFFAMFMFRFMSLGPYVMSMFRSMCLYALCHICVLRSICWLLMPCASIAFLSFDISLSCVLTLIGGV